MVDTTIELKLQIIENERKQLNIDKEIHDAKNKINTFEILIESLILDKEELMLERIELNDELDKKLGTILKKELLKDDK